MERRDLLKTAVSCFLSYGYSQGLKGLLPRTEPSYETASMYGHSLTNRSYLPSRNSPSDEVGIAWEFETDDWVISSPVVRDGNLYVGSFDNSLYCLNPETGDENWEYESEGRIGTTPCVTSDRLFFGNHDGEVICLSTDGTLLWRQELSNLIRSSPKYSDGLLYAAEYMMEGRSKTLDGEVYAFDAETGKTRWSVETDDSLYTSPAVSGGVLYIGGLYKGVLRALDAQNGRNLWEYQAEKRIISSPSVTDNRIYFFDNDGAVCLNKCGEMLWRTDADDMNLVTTTPSVSESSLYFGDGDGNLYSYDRFTGDRNWKRETDHIFYTGGPTLTGDSLLVANHGGEILSLEPETGKSVWKFCLDTGIRTIPEIRDGTIYFGGHGDMYDGGVYALDMDSSVSDSSCEDHRPHLFPHEREVGEPSPTE